MRKASTGPGPADRHPSDPLRADNGGALRFLEPGAVSATPDRAWRDGRGAAPSPGSFTLSRHHLKTLARGKKSTASQIVD